MNPAKGEYHQPKDDMEKKKKNFAQLSERDKEGEIKGWENQYIRLAATL